MAKAKKKSNTKKTTSSKVTTKSNVAATSKKGGSSKKVTSEKETKHVSEKVDKSNNGNPWVVVSAILGIVIILLIAGISSLYFNQNGNDSVVNPSENENKQTTINTTQTGDVIILTVVEDPSCVNCQVDLFTSQIKENLISNLEVVKVSYDSTEGKAILDTVGAKQVPVYLFSDNINQRSDWEEQLKGAFIAQNFNGVSYFMLNPDLVQGKAMIEAPEVPEGSLVIGEENAPVTIIQFTDFECPFCAIADGNEEMVEQFQARSPGYVAPMPSVYKNYVANGDVKIVFMNFPIASLHPESRKAHNAALCANDQDKFEEFSHKLWTDRKDWIDASDKDAKFKAYANDLGLDTVAFNECYDSKKFDSQITAEQKLGQELGVSGTPAFFIGKTFISGAQDFATFKSIIDAELEAKN